MKYTEYVFYRGKYTGQEAGFYSTIPYNLGKSFVISRL